MGELTPRPNQADLAAEMQASVAKDFADAEQARLDAELAAKQARIEADNQQWLDHQKDLLKPIYEPVDAEGNPQTREDWEKSVTDWEDYVSDRLETPKAFKDEQGKIHTAKGNIARKDTGTNYEHEVDNRGRVINTRFERETLKDTPVDPEHDFEAMSVAKLAGKMAEARYNHREQEFAYLDGIISEKVQKQAEALNSSGKNSSADIEEALHDRIRHLIEVKVARLEAKNGPKIAKEVALKGEQGDEAAKKHLEEIKKRAVEKLKASPEKSTREVIDAAMEDKTDPAVATDTPHPDWSAERQAAQHNFDDLYNRFIAEAKDVAEHGFFLADTSLTELKDRAKKVIGAFDERLYYEGVTGEEADKRLNDLKGKLEKVITRAEFGLDIEDAAPGTHGDDAIVDAELVDDDESKREPKTNEKLLNDYPLIADHVDTFKDYIEQVLRGERDFSDDEVNDRINRLREALNDVHDPAVQDELDTVIQSELNGKMDELRAFVSSNPIDADAKLQDNEAEEAERLAAQKVQEAVDQYDNAYDHFQDMYDKVMRGEVSLADAKLIEAGQAVRSAFSTMARRQKTSPRDITTQAADLKAQIEQQISEAEEAASGVTHSDDEPFADIPRVVNPAEALRTETREKNDAYNELLDKIRKDPASELTDENLDRLFELQRSLLYNRRLLLADAGRDDDAIETDIKNLRLQFNKDLQPLEDKLATKEKKERRKKWRSKQFGKVKKAGGMVLGRIADGAGKALAPSTPTGQAAVQANRLKTREEAAQKKTRETTEEILGNS